MTIPPDAIWRTIHGAKVALSPDGKIVAGPKAMVGHTLHSWSDKKDAEAAEHGQRGQAEPAAESGEHFAKMLNARDESESFHKAAMEHSPASSDSRTVPATDSVAAGTPTNQSLHSAPLADFASTVRKLADEHDVGFGSNKVFISHVYEKARKLDPTLTMDQFKARIRDASRHGLLAVSRADLPSAMSVDDVKNSETKWPGTTMEAHFIHAATKDRTQTMPNFPTAPRLMSMSSESPAMLMSKDEPELAGGEWKTVHGAHVYIKDGQAIAGPHHLIGKSEAEIGEHGKAPNPETAKPGFHRIERNAAGDYIGTHKPSGVEHVPEHAERLKRLKISPGYTNLHLSDDPKAMRQAYQTDAKGRESRVYSDLHGEKQAAKKFARVKTFVAKLAELRKAITGDTSEQAAVLHLIDQTGIRIGSDANTGAEKKAYGASTLLAEHVQTTPEGKTALHFTGKKGVTIHQVIDDEKLAEDLKKRAKDGGKLYNTSDAKVREYLHSVAPGFKVKDFRTAVAASTAESMVKSMPAPTNLKELVAARKKVGEAVAAKLNNTAAVALRSYIPPETFRDWETKSANLEQAKMMESHAEKTGMTPNAAAADWVGKNAKSYRERFEETLGRRKIAPGDVFYAAKGPRVRSADDSAGKSGSDRPGELRELPGRADGRGGNSEGDGGRRGGRRGRVESPEAPAAKLPTLPVAPKLQSVK